MNVLDALSIHFIARPSAQAHVAIWFSNAPKSRPAEPATIRQKLQRNG